MISDKEAHPLIGGIDSLQQVVLGKLDTLSQKRKQLDL
jgi:hypothetical protein